MQTETEPVAVSEEAHQLVREMLVHNPNLMLRGLGRIRGTGYIRQLYRAVLGYLDYVEKLKRGEVEVIEPQEQSLFQDAHAPNLPPDHPVNQRSKLWGKINDQFVMQGPEWDEQRRAFLERFEGLKPLPPDQIITMGKR